MIPQQNEVLYRSPQGFAEAMARYDQATANWQQQPTSQFVETRHGCTHVLVAGPEAAPPLMLFHGWGANAAGHGTDPGFAPLFEHFRTYMPDVIGQTGKSDPNRLPTAGNGYGEWAVDIMDALGIERAYATGISGGGFMTLKLAAFAPQRVISGVAVSTAGMAKMLFYQNLKMLSSVLPLLFFPGEWSAQRFVRGLVPSMVTMQPIHREMVEGIQFMMTHMRQTAVAIDPLTEADLRRITAPMLILMGQYEITTDVRQIVARASQFMPTTTTEIVPDVGHIMSFDAPELVTRRILEFFQSSQSR
jgi:pimeloyl-ACP methyl ester carboxylesterase